MKNGGKIGKTLLFCSGEQEKGGKSSDLNVDETLKNKLYGQAEMMLGMELKLLITRKTHMESLWEKAQAHELSEALAADGGHVDTDALAYARGTGPIIAEIDGAISGMRDDCAGGKCWRRSAISKIYDKLVPEHSQYRFTSALPVKYTSSVGGEYLFRYAMQKIPDDAPASIDIALYAYASLTASQIYPDGNKRMGRALYGLVWSTIPGNPAFEAPTVPVMLPLFDMT